jgi:hypothetical protein
MFKFFIKNNLFLNLKIFLMLGHQTLDRNPDP